MKLSLPEDYADRVCAEGLDKVIGVYLGRPFEGWTCERIQKEFGDIEYYVHDKLKVPLVAADGVISGTFTFVRALANNSFDLNLSAKQLRESWLTLLIEKRTIRW